MTDIKKKLSIIKHSIAAYEQKYERKPGSVYLLAASKGQPVEKLKIAIKAGQKIFGENYVQEALIKMEALPKNIEWHFIGHIQTNKTKKIAEHFSWVHSVDSFKIAKRLNDQRPQNLSQLNICIEVNVSKEATKSGVEMKAVIPLIKECMTLPNLQIRGLMTVPKPYTTFSEQQREFHKLFLLKQTLVEQGFLLDTLSMGMSHDIEAAIAEGATIVRIGEALFGVREEKHREHEEI